MHRVIEQEPMLCTPTKEQKKINAKGETESEWAHEKKKSVIY